jgi:glycosyltransferase involved in cell wall biosynthesis
LRWVSRECTGWRGKWVLVQYTALAWSRRGFPFFALAVLATLHHRGARVALVFHEPRRQGGSRWIDRIRGACQDWVLRTLHRSAAKSIFTVPLATVSWLPAGDTRSAFIPIGANIPQSSQQPKAAAGNEAAGTVVVFCLDGMPALRQELLDISDAARAAATNGARLRVLFVGRGTKEAEAEIASAFRDVPVETSILGLLSAAEVSETLAASDLMLCVRGKINQCRGSALAGVACGLPIVAYAGEVEGTPLADAGLLLVPFRDAGALGAAVYRVLADSNLSRDLRKKNQRAQQKHFSWDLIAASYVGLLEGENK